MELKVRNLAIIAHVDHGKTTLVDQLLKTCKTLGDRKEVEERFMDSMDQEKERGITIKSKHISLDYQGNRINIVDTPGHADFGGEVERVLCLADGVLLLVDALEGPMPQTRFVLKKALEHGLKPLVFINKIDRSFIRPDEVLEEILELLLDLDAPEELLDFPHMFGSAREGYVREDVEGKDLPMTRLLEFLINEVPAPSFDPDLPGAIRITSLEPNEFLGTLGIGRVMQGSITKGDKVFVLEQGQEQSKERTLRSIFHYEGLSRVEIEEAHSGELVAIAGIDPMSIGLTLTKEDPPKHLAPVPIDEPTLGLEFTVNTSPLAGQDGKFVTSSKIRERLFKESERNVALRVEETEDPDRLLVSGRGLLHLSILIEDMRREGYEFGVGRPKVITKEENGVTLEPWLAVLVESPEESAGKIIELLSSAGALMREMKTRKEITILDFKMPARTMMGMSSKILTLSRGEANVSTVFEDYEPKANVDAGRGSGSLISMLAGETTAYSLDSLQARGKLFVGPGEKVYEGMVVGENSRDNDLVVNPVKGKKLTNVRASGTDKNVKLAPPIKFSLEEALEFLAVGEMLEVTPKIFRIRKTVLDSNDRKKAEKAGDV